MSSLKFLFFIFIAILSGCSTGTYLKPSAEKGTLTGINPSCPGAEEVITFSPKQSDWVEIRIYALPASRYVGMAQKGTGTELHVEFLLKRGLGLSSLVRSGQEFERRKRVTYSFRASAAHVTLNEPDGKMTKMPVKLFEGERDYAPKYEHNLLIDEERIKLSDRELKQFSIDFPTIFINGEPINISRVSFTSFKDWYFPVLNC